MRIRIIWLVTLFMVASVLASALPKIDVYRYQDGQIDWKLDTASWSQDKKILLLVHGDPMFGSGKMRLTMNGLAVYFSKERKIGDVILPAYDAIYAIEYPKGYTIYETKKAFIELWAQKTCMFSEDQKIDIFAHSLGGLLTRAAIELLNFFPISNKIDHVVMMGTPQNGLKVDELDCFKKCFDVLPVEINDLNPDGLFLTVLNSRENKKSVNCDYYSIVGLRSWAPEQFGKSLVGGPFAKVVKAIQDKNFPVHDGLISSESAGFDLKPYCKSFKLITLDLNHEYINNHQLVFDAVDKWMIDDKWFGGNVQPPIDKFTGGVPILLGQDFDGITKIMKRLPDSTLMDWTTLWTFRNYPFEGSGLSCGFDKDKKVNTGLWYLMDKYGNNSSSVYYKPPTIPFSPSQIVPKEIWAQEPTVIYRTSNAKDRSIVTLWQIAGNTYLAVLANPDKVLYRDVVSINENGQLNTKYVLTDDGKNFRLCNKITVFGCYSGLGTIISPGNFGDKNLSGFFRVGEGMIFVNPF